MVVLFPLSNVGDDNLLTVTIPLYGFVSKKRSGGKLALLFVYSIEGLFLTIGDIDSKGN